MRDAWFSLGAAMVAAAVAAGALGAHALRARLDPHHLSLWETAVRYLFVGGFGLMLGALAGRLRPGRGWTVACAMLAAGAALFSATVAALALGGPAWLGAVTPLGGVLLIAGFALAALVSIPR